MTMKIFPLVALLCLLVAEGAAASPSAEDSLLVRYRHMALDCDDGLKAVAKRIAACSELERSARAERMPTLSAGGDVRYTGNPLKYAAELPGVGPLTLEGQNWKYGASATLLQPLCTGGRIAGAIRMAESETRMSEVQRELLRTEVCYRVDVQYWTTVARREQVSVAEDHLCAVADLERVVRERVEAGLCDRQELLTVEVRHNEARYRLLQVRSDFETGRMALNALIGRPLDAETPVGTTLPEVGPGASGLSAAALHPEIRLAQERIVWERGSLQYGDARYKPQLGLGANAGYYAPGYDFRPDLSPNWALYARLSVPIFQGGRRRRERSAAGYRIGMATDALHRVEKDLDLETRTSRTALDEAQERVALAVSSLVKAAENERRATEKYVEGAISISEVIDAQLYRQTAQENLVAAKEAALLHLARLLRAADGYRFDNFSYL